MNLKRILAIVAVVALIAMYVTTLILAFCDFTGSRQLLGGFIMLDIAVPIMLWILLYVHKRFSNKD